MEFPTKAPEPSLAVVEKINEIPLDELKFLVLGLLANLATNACDCGEPDCVCPSIGQILLGDAATHQYYLEFQKLLIKWAFVESVQEASLRRVEQAYVVESQSN